MKRRIAIAIAMLTAGFVLAINAEHGAQRRQRFAAMESRDTASFAVTGLLDQILVVTPRDPQACHMFLEFLSNADLNRRIRGQGFTRAKCGSEIVNLGR